MEVTITRFRRELFDLVSLAGKGEPVYVTHKEGRFRLVPDELKADRFSRITPLQVVSPAAPDLDDAALKQEMVRAWEDDWAEI